MQKNPISATIALITASLVTLSAIAEIAPGAPGNIRLTAPGASIPPGKDDSPSDAEKSNYPILFVTQLPIAEDFTTVGATFGNHVGDLGDAGRGGDLWIRYPDGSLKNLTKAAGFGGEGRLGANAIAVREPAVHWDARKAVFSMVVGAPVNQGGEGSYKWQLYEVKGLNKNDTPIITKIANQPNYNNVSPVYGSDDRIIFASDRPFNGQAHLYPQLDEYESDPTNTGLWSLNPSSGDLFLMNHAPSGNFTPSIDSQGRVLFMQWDHLLRDQQAAVDARNGGRTFGSFNYSSEAPNARKLANRNEVFPEPLSASGAIPAHAMNHFFPWTLNQDGTEGEVLMHLGRHELHSFIPKSRNDDPNVFTLYGDLLGRKNLNFITNMIQIREEPTRAESYLGVDAPEFGTHASGYVFRLDTANRNADQVVVEYLTDPDTNDGRYRDPLPLSNGGIVVSHSRREAVESGRGSNSDYDFRLKLLIKAGNRYTAGPTLTNGISKSISYWNPNNLVSYNGELWELNPVEVKPRTRPAMKTAELESPEQQMFKAAGVSITEIKNYMEKNNLALIVSRDVTTRDDMDVGQPRNLRVPGGVSTQASGGKIYDVTQLELFEGQLIRGYDKPGRRVLAQRMTDPSALNANPGSSNSVRLGSDGSMAAFVPARRALTWQLTDDNNRGVVKERYWVTFQPGEIRVCTSCHGLNDRDQAGNTGPTNAPAALKDLLLHWRDKLK